MYRYPILFVAPPCDANASHCDSFTLPIDAIDSFAAIGSRANIMVPKANIDDYVAELIIHFGITCASNGYKSAKSSAADRISPDAKLTLLSECDAAKLWYGAPHSDAANMIFVYAIPFETFESPMIAYITITADKKFTINQNNKSLMPMPISNLPTYALLARMLRLIGG
jgi:hypothetical protein